MTDISQTPEMQHDGFSEELSAEDCENEFAPNEKDQDELLLEDDSAINNSCNKRRGEYGFYPPNLRIRIAKMALEKGVSKTADHFSDDLGRYVSPSTVASIRNQYLKEVSQCIEENVVQISELPKAETGRPLLLEELDLHILQCVQKIQENGGAVNAAVIKRITRDIIIANNKSLLLEYGGPFELSNAWAERTLKRITNTNSKQQKSNKHGSGKEVCRSSSPGLEEMKQAYVDIITSAVTTHGLSKELIPHVSPSGPKRRRSQRELFCNSATTTISDDEMPRITDGIDSPQKNCKSASSKYKVLACSIAKGKQPSRKRFRILKVPAKNSTRNRVAQTAISSQQNKCKSVPSDCTNTDIPENELIEMAIPSISGKRKRGDYATYTSDQRICMAKMALDIGVAKTAQHFTTKLGRYVSPSSVASMRNQYRRETEKTRNEVVELPKGKRGRPLLLGHLDSEIKHAIESIKNAGGKVGRNVVKSVARDIILANNRGLLKEYGGPLQLTNTWAESVMKRMGFVRRRKVTKPSSLKNNISKSSKNVRSLTNEFEELNQAYMDVINNAVNTAVSTHGITENLVSNYDHYQTQNLPPPHVGSHDFIPHVNHHSITASHNGFNMENSPARNNQTSVQTNESESLLNLNHLRTSVENFSNSYNPNSYYSGWNSSSHRDFTMMGSYNQPVQSLGIYNSQMESSINQHPQGIERQPIVNIMARESMDLASIDNGSFASSMQMPNITPSCSSRNAVHNIESCENVSSSVSSQLENSPPLASSEPLSMNSISLSRENVNNSIDETLCIPKNVHSVTSFSEHDLSSGAVTEKTKLAATIQAEEINDTAHSESQVTVEKESKKVSKVKKDKETKRKRGEYGVYTSEQRMKMAKLALDYGVTKAASLISDEMGRVVSSSTVASMRNLYLRELEKANNEISELPKGKRGRPLLLGDLDSQIQRCLMNIRINGGVITRMVVVSVARGIILAKNKSLLKENGGPVELSTTWAESVIRRMGFVRQKNDGSVTAFPPDFDNLKSAFLKRITSTVITNSIPKDLILNFGQTSLKIVPSSSWTTEGHSNQQQIPNLDIEDRREITSILTVSLAGRLLPVQLIYTGKTDQCHPSIPFPEDWDVTHTENHLCTSETMMQFAEKLLIPYIIQTRTMLGLASSHKALVIFDVLNMNQDKEFFTKLRENNIEVVLVPTPCTSVLQPLELTVFGRFRDELYKFFFNWYSNEVCEAVRAGQNPSSVIVDLRLSVLKHLHAQWILKTHEFLSGQRNLILEGFGKAGIIEGLSAAAQNQI